MTVSSETNKVTYAGDGATSVFSTAFLFDANNEVSVVLVDADSVETQWLEGTQYTLTGAGTGVAGNVTVDTSPTDYTPQIGETLVIRLAPAFLQQTAFPRGGVISPVDIEASLDNLVRIDLRQNEVLDRTLRLPVELSGISPDLPAPEANKVLSWNTDADAIVNKTPNTPYNSVETEEQTATSGQTVFTLTTITYAVGVNNLAVYINGVRQQSTAFTETNETTVTFSSGLTAGDAVEFVTNDIFTTSNSLASTVSYTPSGTGAVATNVQAKLSESVSVKDFGAVGDGVTDDTAAIQAAIDTQKPVYFPSGTYLCGTVTFPQQSGGQSWSTDDAPVIYGAGRNKSTIKSNITSGYLWQTFGMGGTPGTQHLGIVIRDLGFNGQGNGGTALGIANTRMVQVQSCWFYGFPTGSGIELYSYQKGGMFGGLIEHNYFGHSQWQLNGADKYIDIDVDLLPYALLYGVKLNGPTDSTGKVNDGVIQNNLFYNCIGTATYQTGHGSGFTSGGSGNWRMMGNTIYSEQARKLEEDTAVSATSTTIVIPEPPIAGLNNSNDDYNGCIIRITGGTGEGQYREITDDVVTGTNRTLTVAAWTVTPDATSTYRITYATSALITELGIGNIPAGHTYDHDWGWSSTGDYYEELNAPVLALSNADDNVMILAPIMKVTDSQWFSDVSGNEVTPSLFLGARTRGDDDTPTTNILTNYTLLRAQGETDFFPTGFVRKALNDTGGDLSEGDVCRYGTSGALVLKNTAGAGDDRPVVVAALSGDTVPNGSDALVVAKGSIAKVAIGSITVNENDTMVTAASNVAGIDNAQTDPKKILGYAVSAATGPGFVYVEIL